MKHAFKRKEEKYILPLSVANDIQNIVKEQVHYSTFNQDGELTDIRTTYLENEDFLIYHMKKRSVPNRYKIRIREYGKNGCFDPKVWIELKEKIKGEGYKYRFMINREFVSDFISGKNVFSYVLLENKGIENDYLVCLYERIQGLIRDNNFYPRLMMQYERLALQGTDSQGVRLTFDYNLKGKSLSVNDNLFSGIGISRKFDNSNSIAELKTGGSYPEKASVIKQRYSLHRQSFSKYIYGMESFYSTFHPHPEFLEMEYIPFSNFVSVKKEYAI
jgi:hypothetical protein